MESLQRMRERNLIELVNRHQINEEDALALQSISRRLHRLDEAFCMRELSDREWRRRNKLKRQAEEIANKYGLSAYHQSDPRGWTLYLIKPDMLSNYTQGIAVCPH